MAGRSMDSSEEYEDMLLRELCANGISMKTKEVEAKLDEGNIQEAESSLREGLSLNFEVCSKNPCFPMNMYRINFIVYISIEYFIHMNQFLFVYKSSIY